MTPDSSQPSRDQALAWALERRHGVLSEADAGRLDAALARSPELVEAVDAQSRALDAARAARLELGTAYRARLERFVDGLRPRTSGSRPALEAEPERSRLARALEFLLGGPIDATRRSRGTVLLARAFALWLGVAAAFGLGLLIDALDDGGRSGAPQVAEDARREPEGR